MKLQHFKFIVGFKIDDFILLTLGWPLIWPFLLLHERQMPIQWGQNTRAADGAVLRNSYVTIHLCWNTLAVPLSSIAHLLAVPVVDL